MGRKKLVVLTFAVAGMLAFFASVSAGQKIQPASHSNILSVDDGRATFTLDSGGDLNGPYKVFYDNGKLREEGVYVDGRLDGAHRRYWRNGKLQRRAVYHEGRIEGFVVEFDRQGKPTRIAQYRAGKRHGIFREFRENDVINERTYLNGVLLHPRSAIEITRELQRIGNTTVRTLPIDKRLPATPKHAGTNGSKRDREEALRRLMEYRYLCGLPYRNMVLDERLNDQAEATAALMRDLGKLDHSPTNPGWDRDAFAYAAEGAAESNLFRATPQATNVQSVDSYMDDSDEANIRHLGHRRWCLSPSMQRVGFAAEGRYAAMIVTDRSQTQQWTGDFIAYPAPGMFPSSHFGPRRAWSVSLNPTKYREPQNGKVKVTVTPMRVDYRKAQVIAAGKPLTLKLLTISERKYAGMGGCIIFRPSGLRTTPRSLYQVKITGLRDHADKPVTIDYHVEFFKPAL